MFRKLLSVGGFTLLSRITGFVRDVLMAATLGAGLLSDQTETVWMLCLRVSLSRPMKTMSDSSSAQSFSVSS